MKFYIVFKIHLGSGLNVTGGVIRAIGTSAIFSDTSTQFGISLFGQVRHF